MEAFAQRLGSMFSDMISWRRYLHQNPELSFQEEKTAAWIAAKLQDWGVSFREHVAGYGIIAEVSGFAAGPTVVLRADMDALPIQDAKQCAYASRVPGIMHACGHDAHTSTLLALIKVFHENRQDWRGKVRFLFQPAEETTPGGAASMMKEGALENAAVIYGIHLWTPFPVGTARAIEGPMMAAADEFVIRLRGKGGHGGLPHECIDAVVVGSQLVVNLQSIISRRIDPLKSAVLTIGSIQGGSTFNVISEVCTLKGTVRTFDDTVRKDMHRHLKQVLTSTCRMHDAHYDLDYKWGYPALVNHGPEVQRFNRIAGGIFGTNHAGPCDPVMAAEDFAYYLQELPGCFMFVGAGNDSEGITAPHHHPHFDIDEKAMLYAGRLLSSMAVDFITEHNK